MKKSNKRNIEEIPFYIEYSYYIINKQNSIIQNDWKKELKCRFS